MGTLVIGCGDTPSTNDYGVMLSVSYTIYVGVGIVWTIAGHGSYIFCYFSCLITLYSMAGPRPVRPMSFRKELTSSIGSSLLLHSRSFILTIAGVDSSFYFRLSSDSIYGRAFVLLFLPRFLVLVF